MVMLAALALFGTIAVVLLEASKILSGSPLSFGLESEEDRGLAGSKLADLVVEHALSFHAEADTRLPDIDPAQRQKLVLEAQGRAQQLFDHVAEQDF
jgi:hypothetical protein